MKWYENTSKYFENREDISISLYKNPNTSEFDIIEIKTIYFLFRLNMN